ncbi:MAG: acetoacetate--CoA ligase [Candidatus Thermoplasmatota archaeon]|nr:acetoacetate--CoA ligase [Candidatus Thermoplasmatota archaeon]
MDRTLPMWQPSETMIKNARITHYVEWLNKNSEKQFEISLDSSRNIANYHKIWEWSVKEYEQFWESIWNFFEVKSYSPFSRVISPGKMPGLKWFPGSSLNYAEHILRKSRGAETAIIYNREDGVRRISSWDEVFRQTASLANSLRSLGVKRGDVVAGYMTALPEAVISLLGTASIGAIWSVIGSEISPRAVIDRFSQIEPKVLIASDYYVYNGKAFDKSRDIEAVLEAVPSIRLVILVRTGGKPGEIKAKGKQIEWEEASHQKVSTISYEPVDFNHPLWILYSSGTTGIPKPIVHSHGGMTLEAMKGTLHLDVHENDKFLWYSSPSWMMWNIAVNVMMSGCTVAFYDGSPMYANMLPLWENAEKESLTILGTSAPFIHANMKAGLSPGTQFRLRKLREIGSTAAPLSVHGFRWLSLAVSPDIWIDAASGGSDVCTAFVGGCPILPVWEGEMQCSWLGSAVASFSQEGKSIVGRIGEMVITKPMPSMPLYFWGDNDHRWYRESYYALFPEVWWQGDWITVSEIGTAVISGRSDSTIKRKGVRIGTSDIYKVVESIPEVKSSLAVEVHGLMAIFVSTVSGNSASTGLSEKIRQTLTRELGPNFAPDLIVFVDEIPTTLNYKKLEVPVKKLLMGWDFSKAVNLDSLQNPDALTALIERGRPMINDLLSKQ